jgi:hypothetical protein
MKKLLFVLTAVGVLTFSGIARAEHDKNCKHVHGKVSVISDGVMSLDDKTDKSYKVGDTTRVTKDGEKVKATQIKVGDIVCVDKRGNSDADGEVAAVAILSTDEGDAVIKKKETTKETEKTTEKTKEKEEK